MPEFSSVTSRRWSARFVGALVVSVFTIVLTSSPVLADVSFINGRRASVALPPMASNGGLAATARAHAQEMADRGGLFHTANLASSLGPSVPGWQRLGENVGVGDSMAGVEAMFMNSSAHRANILGDFNVAGVGAVTGNDGRVWVTQTFAKVGGVAAAAAPAAPKPARPAAPRPTTRSAPRVAPKPDPTAAAPAEAALPTAVAGMTDPEGGYRIVATDGGVFTFGDATFAGSAVELDIQEHIVGGAPTSTGNGYVLFGERGGVFTFGDARYHGSAAEAPLNAPIVAGALTPSGDGYVLFAEDGGAMAFGDATYAGGAVGQPLNGAIVGGARTPSGRGYWLAGADGGVYAYGDAAFFGSAAEVGRLSSPIVGIAATATGAGYWLAGADGGVFAFGDAEFFGSTADQPPPVPVQDLIPAPSGRGYWLVRADREVVAFGAVDAPMQRRPGIGPAIMLI